MNNLVNLLVAEAETTVKGLTSGNQNHLIARYCLCDRFGDNQALVSAHMTNYYL